MLGLLSQPRRNGPRKRNAIMIIPVICRACWFSVLAIFISRVVGFRGFGWLCGVLGVLRFVWRVF